MGFQVKIFSNIASWLGHIRTWPNIRRIPNSFENFVWKTLIRTYYATMFCTCNNEDHKDNEQEPKDIVELMQPY